MSPTLAGAAGMLANLERPHFNEAVCGDDLRCGEARLSGLPI
jgi:hypothetical protein